MTDKLPPQLLALFQPRPGLRYIPPQDSSPETRATTVSKISGIAAFLPALQDYKETDEYHPTESWLERKNRIREEKRQALKEMLSEDFEGFRPEDDPKVKGDALKTLFVGRLGYDVKEGDLEREFSRFGPIERIRIVRNEMEKNPKKPHRGYAFVVYERERDMKSAYKDTDGMRIKDRRVIVDVERGRVVKGWKPRRFGGGLGGRNYTKSAAKPTFGGGAPAGPGGFQGGGFRGGFGGRGGGGGGGGFRGGFRGDRGGFQGDRGGFQGGRGGIGFQDRGGFGGRDRGGFGGGYQNGAPPPNAPSGPGGRPGGYSGGQSNGGYEDRGRGAYGGGAGRESGGYGGGGYGGGRERGGITGSNREPVMGRDRGYEERERDRDRDRDRSSGGDRGGGDRGGGDRGGGDRGGYGSKREDDYGSRKRHHDSDVYDDPRAKRRY